MKISSEPPTISLSFAGKSEGQHLSFQARLRFSSGTAAARQHCALRNTTVKTERCHSTKNFSEKNFAKDGLFISNKTSHRISHSSQFRDVNSVLPLCRLSCVLGLGCASMRLSELSRKTLPIRHNSAIPIGGCKST